jgi:threonine dehydrogenase-like Zn-dependent dehydrogenase
MRGLWLENERIRFRDDVPDPRPAPGEALVRVRLAGVCNTDLEMVKGYYTFAGVPGHEFVGEVERADDAPEWAGRRVVGEINASCGSCPACDAGRRSHCERRTVLGLIGRNGTFAEKLALPIANLHAVPDEVPDEAAVFAEPLAAALRIGEQARLTRADRVVVVGDGKLGHLVALAWAAEVGSLIVATRGGRARPALEAHGIRCAAASDLPGASADVVVECTGDASGLEAARRLVRPAGTIVLKSTYRGRTEVDFARIVVDEVTLIGSRCGPFAPALERLVRGQVPVTALVEARFDLAAGLEALERAARPAALKVLLRP